MKVIMPYAYALVIIIQRDLILNTGVYEAVKSTPSSMDDPSTQVLEYRYY